MKPEPISHKAELDSKQLKSLQFELPKFVNTQFLSIPPAGLFVCQLKKVVIFPVWDHLQTPSSAASVNPIQNLFVEEKVDLIKVSSAGVSIVTSQPPSTEQEVAAADQDTEEIIL